MWFVKPTRSIVFNFYYTRQAKDDVELAMLFHVCESTVSKIIKTLINFLYFQLKELEEQFLALKGSHM